jgi:hypothetical protein
MVQASASCFRLFRQCAAWDPPRALFNTGKSSLAKSATMAITTSSSINENARGLRRAHLGTTTIFVVFEARRVRARGLHHSFPRVGRLSSAGVAVA